ncbi:MAG: ERF family protein, partial [Proteobacteria bacterium]|nr:ERF family protein [Pseudomonadota bacterium]
MTDQLIYKKMAEIITAVGSVSKGRTSVGKFSFKYRGIDDVMNALHQAFGEAGVFVQQEVLDHTMSQIEGRGIHHIAKVCFSFVTTDGSSVHSIVYGECIENGD